MEYVLATENTAIAFAESSNKYLVQRPKLAVSRRVFRLTASPKIVMIKYDGYLSVISPPDTESRYLTAFPGEPYVVKRPISVYIARNGDEDYTAFFTEANIAASGESADDAFEGLAAAITDVFEAYSESEPLGPGPAAQLQVLKEHIRRKHGVASAARS